MRRKGDVVWMSVAQALEFVGGTAADDPRAGIEVGVRHVGPAHAAWADRQLRLLKRDELRRILALRADLTEDMAPELWRSVCRPCRGTGVKDAAPVPADAVSFEQCPKCAGAGFVPLTDLETGDVRTPEGEEQLLTVMRRIFSESYRGAEPMIAGTKGLEVDGKDLDAQLDELERLNLLEVFVGPALGVQGVKESFPAPDAGARVAGPEEGPEAPADVGG